MAPLSFIFKNSKKLQRKLRRRPVRNTPLQLTEQSCSQLYFVNLNHNNSIDYWIYLGGAIAIMLVRFS